MPDRIAELGALQDAVTNTETNPARLSLAGYIRGLFLDWSRNPSNPLSRLTVRGRYFGYFWDNGIMPLSLDFANQNYVVNNGGLQARSFSDVINFSRTSNATVTRSDGTIGFAPHNLLTFSEQFGNAAWNATAAITANNAIAPNGYQTADMLTANTVYQVVSCTASTTYTFSFYAKLGTMLANKYLFAVRDDTAGVFIAQDISPSITLTSTEWQRVTYTFTTPVGCTTVRPYIYRDSAGGANGTVYIWGAQLELGSTATTYNPTTVKNLLGFTEAFENAAWTKSNSFVQTNLFTYSEDFSNVAWQKNKLNVTSNTQIAPNGYQTADSVISSATATDSYFRLISALTANTTYTLSIRAKKKDSDWFNITVFDGTNGNRQYYNVANGTLGSAVVIGAGFTSVSSTITPDNNGFYICTITFTIASATTIDRFFTFTDADNNLTITSGKENYVWGAQLVQGSVAGDYRRTDAAALPVFYPNHNGVVCAQKLVEDAATAAHGISQIVTGTAFIPYTYSIYAKKGERTRFAIWLRGVSSGNRVQVGFDLNNGTVFDLQTVGNFTNGSATITNVGNGWYRCSVTGTTGSGETSIRGLPYLLDNASSPSAFSYTGDGTSGIYIFGAQLSDSASLDPYVLNAAAAPASAAYYGPRFDYDPVTKEAKGLLIEEQRSNLITYSDRLNQTPDWTVEASTITADSIVSPDGTQNADTITGTGSGSGGSVYANKGISANTTYTWSVYAKAGTNNWMAIGTFDGTTDIRQYFDLQNGVVGSAQNGTMTSASITNVGNGWYRCTCTRTLPVGATTARLQINLASADLTRTPNGTIFAWGAQLEAGAFATSYIPTVASQVTRTADIVSINGSNFYSWYNQNEGSVYANYVGIQTNAFAYDITNGSTNNRIYLRYLGSPTQSQIFYVDNAATQAQIFDATGSGINTAKTATAYKINDFSVRTNGGASAGANATDSSGNIPIVTQMTIGATVSNTGQINGTIKSITYYNKRLSNDVLQGLTA